MDVFRGHRTKSLDEEKRKRRIHKLVPWIKNPLQGVDKEHLVFAPRHEASTLELFFDLFFVANLATFTAYHSITDHSSLFAYVGFFVMIWVTWFHITLHDVRFAHDTIYERACKTVQMVVFVGFALVGSKFSPGTTAGSNTSFRVLCYTLVLSRGLLALQYVVVTVFVVAARRRDVLTPLLLNILTYIIAAGVFAGMTPAFAEGKKVDGSNGIYSVWWVVMVVESIVTITISCVWRMLSFKKTHLVERMGLLTLIVIGEGAIGVTKTVSRMMGKSGLDPEGCGLVLCIILILVSIWMIYFDNHPHGHYGTIRQQIWSCLHFPIHLAIVGLVEGSQQIALARHILKAVGKIEKSLIEYCLTDHLVGDDLLQKLNDTVNYFQLDSKLQGALYLVGVQEDLDAVVQLPDMCADAIGTTFDDLPETLQFLYADLASGIYYSSGIPLPFEDKKGRSIIQIALESWRIIYLYFWTAMLILLACFIICMILIRRNKIDIFDWASLLSRGGAFIIAAAMLGIAASEGKMYAILQAPGILPGATCLFLLIIIIDRLAAIVANWRNRKSGEALTGLASAEPAGHGHGPDGDHKGTASVSVVTPVPMPVPGPPHRMSYNPLGWGVMPQYSATDTTTYSPAYAPVAAAPVGYTAPSPAPTGYTDSIGYATGTVYVGGAGYAPGGYMPVGNPQNVHGV